VLDGRGNAGEDSEPPVIAAVFTDPPDGFCSGGDLIVNAEVNATDVADVTLWWRAYTDDVAVPDFTSSPMDGGDGVYRADLSGVSAEIVEYYVSARDYSGNYAETAPYSISGAACASY
jgi:hypothetical protein